MKRRILITHAVGLLLAVCFFFIAPALRSLAQSAGETDGGESSETSPRFSLVHAAMCETVKDYLPHNEAIAFHLSVAKVSCFTSFDHISGETVIYHKWFRRDKLTAQKKLTLKPPRWTTFSSMHLKDRDKGPWQLEITDAEDNILQILRFSVTD